MKFSIKSLGLSLLLAFSAAHFGFGQSTIDKSFENIDKIDIEGGSIEITYEGKDNTSTINVHADLGSNEDAGKNLVFVTIGSTLKVSYQTPANSWKNNDNHKKYVHITGPSAIKLSAANSSGILQVRNVSSDLTSIKVSSGIAEVDGITGDLELSGSSGKIMASNVNGNVTCKVTSGMADLENINGNANLSSSSGQVKARQVAGEMNVKVSSGSASLEEVGTLGELRLSSGMVSAKDAGLGPNTSFSGSSGAFKIKSTSNLSGFNYDLKAGSGMVKVGNESSSDQLVINHGATHTIKGQIGSGMISIVEK